MGTTFFLRRVKGEMQLLGHQELGSKYMTHSLKIAPSESSAFGKLVHALTPDLIKSRWFFSGRGKHSWHKDYQAH